jgi:hypothetical protein
MARRDPSEALTGNSCSNSSFVTQPFTKPNSISLACCRFCPSIMWLPHVAPFTRMPAVSRSCVGDLTSLHLQHNYQLVRHRRQPQPSRSKTQRHVLQIPARLLVPRYRTPTSISRPVLKDIALIKLVTPLGSASSLSLTPASFFDTVIEDAVATLAPTAPASVRPK